MQIVKFYLEDTFLYAKEVKGSIVIADVEFSIYVVDVLPVLVVCASELDCTPGVPSRVPGPGVVCTAAPINREPGPVKK